MGALSQQWGTVVEGKCKEPRVEEAAVKVHALVHIGTWHHEFLTCNNLGIADSKRYCARLGGERERRERMPHTMPFCSLMYFGGSPVCV